MNDRIRQLIGVTRQVTYGDPDNFNAVCFEPGVSLQIALWPVAHVMTYPIQLNRQSRCRTIEIKNIRSDRMLPALEATLRDLGIDLASQENVHLDLEQRPGKSPRAFCSPIESMTVIGIVPLSVGRA